MYYINKKSILIFELVKIKQAMKLVNYDSLNFFSNEYREFLSLPKDAIHIRDNFIFCSPKYSYHLLSTYLLLDTIDNFLLNKRDNNKSLKADTSLYSSLDVSEKTSLETIDYNSLDINKINSIIREDIHVFFLPFKSDADFELKITYPGNILIIYDNEGIDLNHTLYEGMAEFYYKKKLRKKLPFWAKNESEFKKEFVAWCTTGISKFKNL